LPAKDGETTTPEPAVDGPIAVPAPAVVVLVLGFLFDVVFGTPVDDVVRPPFGGFYLAERRLEQRSAEVALRVLGAGTQVSRPD